MFDKAGKRVCVCMCWHVLDAIVEMSVISIYLFVRWHIKALNRKSHSVFFFCRHVFFLSQSLFISDIITVICVLLSV